MSFPKNNRCTKAPAKGKEAPPSSGLKKILTVVHTKVGSIMKTFICGLVIVLFAAAMANAQTNSGEDDAAIKVTALNYIEGWYEGDAARMESALHPELAKRMIYTDPKTGHSQFNHMGAMQLVQNTRRGGGNKTPKDEQLKEITILDRFNNAAVVKIVTSGWIDYLEVGKFNGQWKIINVLWELKPKPAAEPSAAPLKP